MLWIRMSSVKTAGSILDFCIPGFQKIYSGTPLRPYAAKLLVMSAFLLVQSALMYRILLLAKYSLTLSLPRLVF